MTEFELEFAALRPRSLRRVERRAIREPDERDAYWINVQRRLAESDAAFLMRCERFSATTWGQALRRTPVSDAVRPLTRTLGPTSGWGATSLTAASELVSIGAFAQRSRLSNKALRLYAELGLLPPAWVDPETGYRFYRPEQVHRARLLGLLRRLDMPLARIGRVLELSGPDAAREVAAFWAETEAAAAVKRRLVAYLERHLEGRGELMYQVETREVPQQSVATLQRSLTVGDLPAYLEDRFRRLEAALREADAVRAGPFFVVYHGEVKRRRVPDSLTADCPSCFGRTCG